MPELPFPADPPPRAAPPPWSSDRWARLAAGVGLGAEEPLVLALSGGADSVFLLHLLAAARPRPRVLVAHVAHGLRGAESEEDARFCAELARAAGFEFARLPGPLSAAGDAGPTPSGLEARARTVRYRALARAAVRFGARVIATGHHADDSLETLLLRWTRGAELGGFRGVPARTVLPPARSRGAARDEAAPPPDDEERLNPTRAWLCVVRPLHALRREEVRASLRDAGCAWREDASNASADFARNRVRHALLPALRAACDDDALLHLAAFARSVEELEDALAARTAALAWSPPRHAAARRAPAALALGGWLARSALTTLAEPLLTRALHRLVAEGTGRRPSRATVERVTAALRDGRTGEHPLHAGWALVLRRDRVLLEPPPSPATADRAPGPRPRQLSLPYAAAPALGPDGVVLALPGAARLVDGRVLLAEFVEPPPGADVPRDPACVELDAAGLEGALTVRAPRPGDRFHALGAPGSRPLSRFLRDAGIPRRDRAGIAVVCAGDELVWVAGVRPAEARRVRAATRRRLRLTLEVG